jgi:dihydroorotase
VGVETLLPVSLELVHRGEIELLDLLAKLTVNPAKLLDLPGGTLTQGGPADIVLFDIDRPFCIDADSLSSKSKNSAFDGRPVQGLVIVTMVDGRLVYDGRKTG